MISSRPPRDTLWKYRILWNSITSKEEGGVNMIQRKVLSLSMSLEIHRREQHILKWHQEMHTHCRTQRDYTWWPRGNETSTIWGWVTENVAFYTKNIPLNWPMYVCTYWLNVYSGNSVGIILFSINFIISYLEYSYPPSPTLRLLYSVVLHINYKSEVADIPCLWNYLVAWFLLLLLHPVLYIRFLK